MSYLPETHHLLRSMSSVEHAGTRTDWIPRDQFEEIVKERDDLRKALAVVNVGVRIQDPRLGIDVGAVLDGVGETFEQARATGSIILSVRER